MPSGTHSYPVLSRDCTLRLLEVPSVFHAPRDQLYEIDKEALDFLLQCNGTSRLADHIARTSSPDIREFIAYLRDEGILELRDRPAMRELEVNQSPIPSLRYLLVHITTRCNLQCRHCYLGNSTGEDLAFDQFKQVVDEFEHMGGLKIMLTGGEPLLHPGIWDFLAFLQERGLRVVILSNGTLIGEDTALKLVGLVHEVQVSIDGTASHNVLRGTGTLARTLAAVNHLKAAGIAVSVASMVHARNLDEFAELEELVTDLDVLQWSVDVPCEAGYLAENPDWAADLSRAAALFSTYGFGAGAHESTGRHTCGTHLAAVMANGDIVRCGFFADEPAGTIRTGLEPAWQRLCKTFLWDLDDLACARCESIEECHGGCRFRARSWGGTLFSPDPVMCLARGVDPDTMKQG